ncbi:hypothetical protein KQI76_00845 [Amphibacillus sp. MSJ-3]|uniref:hypothetical protein n=1 Tax=Amphibacillus sp. MSJ-3 TaxID=2841505 RepID=UPI001C0EF6D2|nr:hypothetical protein [Amphibacillus sp. MSJ-3]MBU5593705.1 hypothetical protein [Amphibacillus sp. MSJ-3]
MIRKRLSLIFITSLILFASGCSLSEEETLENIRATIDRSFSSQALEPNREFDNFNIYLPEHFTVIEESDRNLIFNDQDQTYILFYNDLEDASSEAFYQAEKAGGQYDLLETYQDDDHFAYVKVTELERDFELQVGVGGVRITTQTSLNHLEEDFTEIVKMINSIQFQDFEEQV